ncbi:hypothetical protein [Deinococcus alpinitundrae]|uniref:hypothetical protein n=1 Tax=Deinococcus alpinitundrae TaxID=468913 RepID=UPI0013796ACF|nr:hypothetical protein [Deinococcus alpinitundrae]
MYGRQNELRQARERLEHSALLSVTGPAQRGKTRFAEQLMGELAGSFERTLHVALPGGLPSGSDPAPLLSRIAEALLGRPSAHVGAASVGRLLARQPTLLLLDVPAGHPPLPARQIETLLDHAPLSRIIVAAPTPLGARHESVQALALLGEQAVSAALLDARPDLAERPRAEFAALLEWIGGEPLRLETATAVLRRDQTVVAGPGPQRMFDLLGEADTTGDFSAAGPLFGEHEQRVLAALDHVGEAVDLSWAAQLSGASPFLLGALRDQQYLQALGGGLYRLSGAARHASGHPARSPALRRQVTRRLLDRLSVLLGARPPGSAAWYAQLDQHYPSLRAVTTSLVSGSLAPRRATKPHRGGPQSSDARLARVLLKLTPYRLSRDYLHDARTELQALLRRTKLPHDLRLPLQLAAVQVLQQLGQHQAAQQQLDELPPEAHAQPHTALVQARLLHRRSQYDESLALFDRIRAQLGDQPGELLIRAQDGSARSAIYLGQLGHAQPMIALALAQARALAEPLLLSDVLNTAALVATEQRELEEASRLFGEAIEIHQLFGHRAGLTLNLTGLAWAALLAGNAAIENDRSWVLRHQL